MIAVVNPSPDFKGAAFYPKIEDVVIPVGGLGSRMWPLTLSTPKNLLPVGRRTLIEYAVEEAVLAGIKRIHLICSPRDANAYYQQFYPSKEVLDTIAKPGKEELKARVERVMQYAPMINIQVQENPRGLGHAVLEASGKVKGDFAVILPDDLMLDGLVPNTLQSMIGAYQGGISIAAMRVTIEDTKKYGIFSVPDQSDDYARSYLATAIVEKPKANPPSQLAAMGRYILPLKIMDVLEKTGEGAGGEIQLTDAIDSMCASGTPLHAVRFPGTRYDCGDMTGYMQAQIAISQLEMNANMQMKPAKPAAPDAKI